LVGVQYGYVVHLPILRDIHFSFRRGHVYAVIGPSGSGKSTLADVLLGLVDLQHGQVLGDGRPLDSAALRGRVVLVEQQPRIFSVSIRDNLTLGLARGESEIEDALRTVGLLDFVQSTSLGLGTVLDYQGANLSGGQRQRLSIARALIRHPQILILDEATSALDPTTRDAVIERVSEFMRDGIVILITHDETLAALADSVLSLMPQQADAMLIPTS
jgi:ATP-binding cassette subfamily B protein